MRSLPFAQARLRRSPGGFYSAEEAGALAAFSAGRAFECALEHQARRGKIVIGPRGKGAQ